MMGMLNIRLLSAFAAALAIPQVFAQTLPPSVAACADETDVLERLACYDREVARYRAHPAATSAVPTPVPAPAAPSTVHDPSTPPASAAEFGMTAGLKRKEGRAPSEPPKVDKLTARITAVSSKPTGEAIYTLEGGQTWVEAELRQHLALHTGEEVSITRGVLGVFYLSAAEVRGLRVKRVR